MSNDRIRCTGVLKYGGGIVAFLIGSGFASGQEVMQFFTAYGNLKTAVGKTGVLHG